MINDLSRQCIPYLNEVEFIYLGDNKTFSVGMKRNIMLRLAQGEFLCFVDDDDKLSGEYVREIYNAIEKSPEADCIVFDVAISQNGGAFLPVKYGIEFSRDRNFSDHFERLPNHLMVIKREIALKVDFPDKNIGEDSSFSRQLVKHIKVQKRINKILYFYVFDTNTTEAQKRKWK